MPQIKSRRTRPLIAIALMVLLGATIAACGSSSSGSTSATTAASTTRAQGPGAARFGALRECLKKEGITLPTPNGSKAGGGKGAPPTGGGFLPGAGTGARQLPNGVSRSKFEAAMKKCGGGSFSRLRGGNRLNSAAFKQSLTKFAACMRQNGIDVPAPNTSGNGPIFDTKGLDTGSGKFRSAQQKCSSLLRIARPGGTAGGPGAGGGAGAPGGGGAPSPAG